MNNKRKISYRKILQTLLTVVLVGAAVMVLLSASHEQRKKHITDVIIKVDNQEETKFISVEEIEEKIFEQRHLNPRHFSVEDLDINAMERILDTNPWVDNSLIYVDNAMRLNIKVTQRKPLLRVFEKTGYSYYIDAQFNVLPIKENYPHYELLFVNVPELKQDSISDGVKAAMLKVASVIKADTFWQAQTSCIAMVGSEEFELIPVMGGHKVLLGDTTALVQKLENVFGFYQKILSKVGWSRYQILDARFDNQIVASPSIPFKTPVDRALSNMNWVKTIVGKDPNQL